MTLINWLTWWQHARTEVFGFVVRASTPRRTNMVSARLVHQPGHIRVPDAIKAMVLAAVTSSSITKAHLQLLVLIRTLAGAIPTTGVGQIDTFDAALALPDERLACGPTTCQPVVRYNKDGTG
jgi:hypothetical protein